MSRVCTLELVDVEIPNRVTQVCDADRLTIAKVSSRLVCMTNQSPATVTNDALRHAAAVAADYAMLQGLINVTTGVGLVLWAFAQPALGAVVMGAGVAVWTSYYTKRFGRAVSRGSVLVSLAVVLAAFVVCIAGFVTDELLHGPVLVLPLVAAVCLIVAFRIGYRHVGVTPAHWVAVGVLVLGALAPVAGLGVLGARTGVLLLGLAMMVIGFADHVRLVAAMKPVPRD